jgi:thioredoxin reductase
MNIQNIDVIVVGGGSAGCAAATVVARNRWKTVVVDRALKEGFLGSLGNVSYFPGFAESLSGEDLIKKFRKQAELVGANFKSVRVRKLFGADNRWKIEIDNGETLEARAVILASGAAARTNYLHGEKEFLGRGVSHDALSDGPIFSQRKVAVIGKNQIAVEEALRLSRFASQVIFIIPSSRIDADESLQTVLRDNKRIEPYLSTSLKKINGTDHVKSITVFTGGSEKDIEVNGVFPYVHDYQPMNEFIKDAVEVAGNGAVKIDDEFRTSAGGVFACGDILCGKPQQPAIACAQGMLAGLSVDKYLSEA